MAKSNHSDPELASLIEELVKAWPLTDEQLRPAIRVAILALVRVPLGKDGQ